MLDAARRLGPSRPVGPFGRSAVRLIHLQPATTVRGRGACGYQGRYKVSPAEQAMSVLDDAAAAVQVALGDLRHGLGNGARDRTGFVAHDRLENVRQNRRRKPNQRIHSCNSRHEAW